MSRIEALEPRRLFTAYVVDTLSDTIAVDGSVSLREAITAANTNSTSGDAAAGSGGVTDSITFDSSINNGTITLNGTRLVLTEDLNINGLNSGITLDGNAQSQILVISTGQFTISGLTLENGVGATGGAVSIINAATVTFQTMEINNSLATGRGGAGIYVGNSSSLDLANSNMSGNVAVGTIDTHGGAIYADTDSIVDLVNCNILRNYTTGFGGGIYSRGSDFDMAGTTVSENATLGVNGSNISGGGGGIALDGVDEVLIQDSSISRNSVLTAQQEGGGGIYLTGASTADVEIEGTVLDANGVYGVGGSGGGIFSEVRLVVGPGTEITDNVATGDGGGIFSNWGLTVNEANIERNQAGGSGGGIALDEDSGAILNDAIISGNAALNGSGGGIYWDDVIAVSLQNCEISFNFAADDGGGVFSSSGVLAQPAINLEDCLIASNLALGNGGGIAGWNFSIEDMVIRGNTAVNGGGVWAGNGDVLIRRSAIYGNRATSNGGGIFNTGSITLNDLDVFDNTADSSGGGIYTGAAEVNPDYFHDNQPDNVVLAFG